MSSKQYSPSDYDHLRHSTAHLLAAAVLKLYPQAKLALGPAIETGFYYDIDFGDQKISDKDLKNIERKMHSLVKSWKSFTKHSVTTKQALQEFTHNPYKQELIHEFAAQDQELTIYQSGEFRDLCRGGHITCPQDTLLYFKLLSVAGAYWRGDEQNPMLTRIYGTAFFSLKDLQAHLHNLKEAHKRDHKVLGVKLDLFVINDDIGKGLPLLTPKGTVIRNQILSYERELLRHADFQEVWTPHIAKNDLYKRTGHWQHYQDVMYAPFGIDQETYVLKPMNCPHHYMIYESKPRSYKDLPFRLTEPGTCYRYEKSGELGGLTRVRALTIDDSHILMQASQIDSEFATCIGMVKTMFRAFGLTNFWVRLSLNDPNDNVKYITDSQTWEKAGHKLEQIVKDNQLKYQIYPGEASFYGPKIDFMVQDAIGRHWQMSTLQLDLFMAKKLGLVYTDSNGQDDHPIILHFGLTGSLERTIGILIEHFAGAFPVWLAPTQVIIIPISQDHTQYAHTLHQHLLHSNVRVETLGDGSMQNRIRLAEKQKVPYMLVVGDQEIETHSVSIRSRGQHHLGTLSFSDFSTKLQKQITAQSLTTDLK